jgi:hypothetical protein
MIRAADAIVTGFVKSPAVLAVSLAPLRRLKQENVLRRIVCVTWDSQELDAHVAAIAAMPDVELVRVPQPVAGGGPNQRGVLYQIRNLDAALSRIEGDSTLVLKWRPDFIAPLEFLREKISGFDRLCEVPGRSAFGVAMQKPVLQHKIWVPWADSNHPFFCEDAVFLGTKRDLARLVTPLSQEDLEMLGEESCNLYAHIVRYARIFLSRYPLFGGYLRNYRYFVNDLDYRVRFTPFCLNNGFFWHLLIAHAWILHSQFHVDAGEPGDIIFYANNVNKTADWSKLETLRTAIPYNQIDLWRSGTQPGFAMKSINRPYGRLVDDAWQRALFTADVPDFPRATLKRVLENVAQCADGRLAGLENEFYRSAGEFHRRWWPLPEATAAQG